MSTHKHIDIICLVAAILALVLCAVMLFADALGIRSAQKVMGYEKKLFDTERVHSIDIIMDDWDSFLQTCENEEYAVCSVVIDGEAYSNVGIRAKGNTSLRSVSSMNSDRYSFKIEFDQYDNGKSYHGLDKLSLNNLIQDTTMMKDYLTYRLMGDFGAAAPLCSYAYITVNGEDWGLYLAVEAVEDSFLQRNYGTDHGELYKPDGMNMGGGRGNGQAFDMDAFLNPQGGNPSSEREKPSSRDSAASQMPSGGMNGSMGGFGGRGFDTLPAEGGEESGADGNTFPQMPQGFDPSAMFGGTIPEGFDPSAMLGGPIPESFDPSAMFGGTMPEGFDPSAMFGGTMPEGFEPSAMFGGSVPQMPGGGMNGGMGGGFGMGGGGTKLQYSNDDPASYSVIFSSAKTDITEADQLRLIAALKALGEGTDPERAVDIDAALRYFVVHNFVVNGDSYTGSMVHNYYLYEENGLLAMIPWDYNLAFGSFQGGNATNAVNDPIDTPLSVSGSGDRPMADWIFRNEKYTQMYHEYFAEFLESTDFAALIDETTTLIAPYVEKDPTKFCTFEAFERGAAAMREFCLLREESILGQLNGTIPSTDAGQAANNAARVDASHLTVSDMGSMGMGGGRGGNESSRGEMPVGGSFGGMMPNGGNAASGMTPPSGNNAPSNTAPPSGSFGQGSMGMQGGERPSGTAPADRPAQNAPQSAPQGSAMQPPAERPAKPEKGANMQGMGSAQRPAGGIPAQGSGSFAPTERGGIGVQRTAETTAFFATSLIVLLGLVVAFAYKRRR